MTRSLHIGTKFSRESELLDPVARFAKQLGFRLQTAELPFYEYRIDLYGFSQRSNTTIAIELKLTDWRRALEQAMLYQLCSDFVYIAMPESSARRVNTTELQQNGVGLLSVVNPRTCSCIVQASEHNEVRPFYRRTQIAFLKETANA
jgi:hypothetical protein